MERDKRGRFVKKAQLGTKFTVPETVTLYGKPYKLKLGIKIDAGTHEFLSMAMLNPDLYAELLGNYYEPTDKLTSHNLDTLKYHFSVNSTLKDPRSLNDPLSQNKIRTRTGEVKILPDNSTTPSELNTVSTSSWGMEHARLNGIRVGGNTVPVGINYTPISESFPELVLDLPNPEATNIKIPEPEFKFDINNIKPPSGYSIPKVPELNLSTGGLNARANHIDSLNNQNTFGLTGQFATPKIKYTVQDGKYIDQYGKELNPATMDFNLYERDFNIGSILGTETVPAATDHAPVDTKKTDVKSAGMTITDKEDSDDKSKSAGGSRSWTIDKTKLANFLELARAGIGASINNKIAERALEAEKPFLQDVSESHRSVYGDYRAQVEGEKAAAKLRNMASKPMTSDGALQQQMMMEAQIKGLEYIDKGKALDEALIRQTREAAWQQEKENQLQRLAVAMQNRQSMLMTEKNKAQIENTRDSANYSQILAPLLAGTEQRLRNEGVQQQKYLDYYDNALVKQDVWNNYRDDLSESQKNLAQTFATKGRAGVDALLKDNTQLLNDWASLQQIMNNEIIRRQALIKGAIVNPQFINNVNPYSVDWASGMPVRKKGGTIYKAKLTKRTKDNDRGAKSIESSKKLAARLLEKAIDSLYTYDQVDIIAKPSKKKRKYQAGGGLPFVNFSPVFATSEKGADDPVKEKKGEDLTTKDVLTLLKDMDGLPSDMSLIVEALQDFQLQEDMDPFGLSSSSISSLYINLINKIKVAKFNREEYNQAFNLLKGNGGLNEYAVTSDGLFIGSNREGDFNYFTPDLILSGELRNSGYSLLTNSNLLYLRANSQDAAFNHQLTTVALNGIGMEVITKQINDIIANLGSDKEALEGFIKMGLKGLIKEGLKYLQKVVREVGDDSVNENMSVADYYQAGYLTEDQATQAQLALNYIWSALPNNAKSLLQVKGGGAEGAKAIVKSLVYSKTSTDTLFKASPKKMSSSSSSSSGGADDMDKLKLSPVQMMQVGYTDHQRVTLQKGTTYATTVNAQVLPITDVNKKLLGITTLDRVAESTFGGALDMNNVTMGSQLIDPLALQNVQIDSTNLYVMNLPIDKNSPDGTIKPDLMWMSKIEEIDKVIRDNHITDIAQINKLYTDAGLPVLMDSNGQLNILDYCKFGVLNGHALNSAFKDLDLLDNTVLEIDDENLIENVLNILNKGRNEKDRISFDSKSWADSIFGTSHDSLYEGTIYIPVRTNAFAGMIGGGEYPTTALAEEVEALEQQKERTRGYIDPGLLI